MPACVVCGVELTDEEQPYFPVAGPVCGAKFGMSAGGVKRVMGPYQKRRLDPARRTRRLREGFNPKQRRYPKGSPRGGQFAPAKGGGGAGMAGMSADFDMMDMKQTADYTKEHIDGLPYYARSNLDLLQWRQALAEKVVDDPDVRTLMSEHFGHDVSGARGRQTRLTEETLEAVAVSWNSTTGDSSALSVAIQKAVKREFGLGDAKTDHLGVGSDKPLSEGAVRGLQKIFRAQYDKTQQHLKEAGVKELVIFRGLNFDPAKKSIPGEILAIPTDKARATTVTQQPASSWTTDSKWAEAFSRERTRGGGGQYVMLGAKVPAERVLGLPATGLGTKFEKEVVLLGGTGETLARRADTAQGRAWSYADFLSDVGG